MRQLKHSVNGCRDEGRESYNIRHRRTVLQEASVIKSKKFLKLESKF